MDELIWPLLPLRFERDDRTVGLSLDGENHCQSFFTGWIRATWDDVAERSLLQAESDDLIVFEEIFRRREEKRLALPSRLSIRRGNLPNGRKDFRSDGSGQAPQSPSNSFADEMIGCLIIVLLVSANLPEKKTRSLFDDGFPQCTFLWPNRSPRRAFASIFAPKASSMTGGG